MTPTPPPPALCPRFVVLDFALPERPPLGHAVELEAAKEVLAALQEQFYDQLDANGEGSHHPEIALSIAPVDATGAVGPPCYWAITNGMRPAQQ